jgi:UDP-N-acetylglucosamine transferase subunit ALG13
VIFVTVGTNEAPFDRLVRALEAVPAGEEMVVQHGASRVRVDRASHVDFMPFDELVEYVAAARAVVTHAGVGSIIVALANGKRPIVVPRLHRFREAVDDHQLSFARRFARAGLVTLIEDPQRLAQELADRGDRSLDWSHGDSRLAAELRGFLSDRVGRRAARPAEVH